MVRNPEKYTWITHIKDLLCSHGIGNIWRDQSMTICGELKTIYSKF